MLRFTYLYQSSTFCLGPRSSFLKLIPTTLVTPLKSVAILVRPNNHKFGSKNLSPKNPFPSELLQHHPGWVMWLSNITITSLSPRLFTTACNHYKKTKTNVLHTQRKLQVTRTIHKFVEIAICTLNQETNKIVKKIILLLS